MNLSLFIRLFFILFFSTLFLYFYIDKQNQITRLRLTIPTIEQEIEELKQETVQLHYEIDQKESPERLLSLLKQPEYSHLKFRSE
jgi:cell division protein FtsL